MKNWKKILLACALLLVIGGTVRPALSYFTTYARAKGSVEMHLEETNQIKESVDGLTKNISITNTGTPAVYIRAQGHVASGFKYKYTDVGDASGHWIDGGDGWWYYSEPVAPKASTGTLEYKITDLPEGTIGKVDFNVVIVYESAPVIYGEDGNPKYEANDPEIWSQVVKEGGN